MERNTRQRDTLKEVILQAERPLSPQEMLERARELLPALGLATVYRSIKSFQQSGFLTAVEIAGQAIHYERADLQHHHHFCCTKCGKVFEMEGCPGPLDHMAPAGFEVERHEVTLFGLCADCAGSSAKD